MAQNKMYSYHDVYGALRNLVPACLSGLTLRSSPRSLHPSPASSELLTPRCSLPPPRHHNSITSNMITIFFSAKPSPT